MFILNSVKVAKRLIPLIIAEGKKNYTWEAEPYTKEQKALDLMGAFLLMIETVQQGNKKFSYQEILLQWWKVAFNSAYPYETLKSPPHDIVKVASALFLKSCKDLKVLPIKNFMKLYKTIQSSEFYSYSQKKVNDITIRLTEYTLLEAHTSRGIENENN